MCQAPDAICTFCARSVKPSKSSSVQVGGGCQGLGAGVQLAVPELMLAADIFPRAQAHTFNNEAHLSPSA